MNKPECAPLKMQWTEGINLDWFVDDNGVVHVEDNSSPPLCQEHIAELIVPVLRIIE